MSFIGCTRKSDGKLSGFAFVSPVKSAFAMQTHDPGVRCFASAFPFAAGAAAAATAVVVCAVR